MDLFKEYGTTKEEINNILNDLFLKLDNNGIEYDKERAETLRGVVNELLKQYRK